MQPEKADTLAALPHHKSRCYLQGDSHEADMPDGRMPRSLLRGGFISEHLKLLDFIAAVYGTLEERFWARVQKTNGCWLWNGPHSLKGYGRLILSGKEKQERKTRYVYMHRLSYEIHFGPILKRILVLHKCDVPSCVNPKHLFLGTQLDNVHDMDAKGRRGVVQGSSHPNSVLTDGQVREMRRLHTEEGHGSSALARWFHVSQGTAWKVITPGWAWNHMEYTGKYEGKPSQSGLALDHISYSKDMHEFISTLPPSP